MVNRFADDFIVGIKCGIATIVGAWAMTQLMGMWGYSVGVKEFLIGCVNLLRHVLGV